MSAHLVRKMYQQGQAEVGEVESYRPKTVLPIPDRIFVAVGFVVLQYPEDSQRFDVIQIYTPD